jgi:hypothetical protein
VAVQHLTHLSIINQQKPVVFFFQLSYYATRSDWMVLIVMDFPRPHNPPVAGSSPACPTFLNCSHNYVLKAFMLS